MDFVSFSFVLLYCVALLCRFTVGRTGRGRRYIVSLVVLSSVFYVWHVPIHFLLLVAIVLVHYISGLTVERYHEQGRSAKSVVILAISVNIGILGVFKYADFLLGSVISPLQQIVAGHQALPESLQLALPVAISFYTFQTISYTIDVHRGKIRAERDFLSYFFYVGFFPQLIAGPIVRAWEFLYQIARVRRPSLQAFLWGSYLIIRGFFLKLVVADNLDFVVDRFWDDLSRPETPAYVSLSVPFIFSIQLLCDFMAYTDIARGIAYHLGFRLPINFNAPYIAATFREFWKRWHITLSRWFKDYLYIPLGGDRAGTARVMFNILLVFLLSGLWHGANLTFLAWGAILGAALALERSAVVFWQGYSRRFPELPSSRTPRLVLRVSWYIVVQLTWVASLVFFRSADVGEALKIFAGIFSLEPAVITGKEKYHYVVTGWILTIPVLLLHLRALLAERLIVPAVLPLERFTYAGIMLALTLMLYSSPRSFIYFQF